jgi:hypothetical protein
MANADHAVKCGITLASGSPVRPVLSTRLRPSAIFVCLDHDCHIASATAATVHAAVQATASASQIVLALRCGGSGSSSAGRKKIVVGSGGSTSPSSGSCACFISRSPRVGNTRRRRFTQSRARNHADLSRGGRRLKTKVSPRTDVRAPRLCLAAREARLGEASVVIPIGHPGLAV